MLTFEIIRLRGISGVRYPFKAYVLNSKLRSIEAVFVISSRISHSDGRGDHNLLYIGQTDDLAARLSYFQKLPWMEQNSANSLLVLGEDEKEKRIEIVEDIKKYYNLENDCLRPCSK